MKNISLYDPSNFHGLSKEDTYTFIFDFDVLFHSYDYSKAAQKMKLFPATLKDSYLLSFMELGRNSIQNWNNMNNNFLNKYQDYYKVWDIKEEVFKMSQEDDKSLEDYAEIFKYNLQRTKQNNLD